MDRIDRGGAADRKLIELDDLRGFGEGSNQFLYEGVEGRTKRIELGMREVPGKERIRRKIYRTRSLSRSDIFDCVEMLGIGSEIPIRCNYRGCGTDYVAFTGWERIQF